MRSPKWYVLVALICVATGPVTFAQSAKPSDASAQSKSEAVLATEAEVQQLRREGSSIFATTGEGLASGTSCFWPAC